MNIWCISKYASPPKYSKMATRLFNYCQEWIKLGHDVTLFTSDSNHLANYPETEKIYNYELIDNVPMYWIRTKKYTKSASVARVLSWFDFERKLFCFNEKLNTPDVVIVSSLSLFSIIYGYYLKKKYNSKLVFEIRDVWPLTLTEEGGFSKWHPLVLLMGVIEKFGYNVSDLIVGTMPCLYKHVETIIDKKFKFYCAPFGFRPENYTIDIDSLCKCNKFDNVLPENKVIIGYAGSMGITNALESFIEVIKDLNKINQNIHFALVGSGDLRQTFEDQLSGCNNVTFLPRIAQNDVKFFLAKCDVLYLSTKPSKLWDFGQSLNKVVEYMLAGKPIIASFSGYPSMINEADCGFFVKPNDNDALKNIFLNISKMTSEEREFIGKRGLHWMWKNRKYSTLAKNYMEQLIKIRDYD